MSTCWQHKDKTDASSLSAYKTICVKSREILPKRLAQAIRCRGTNAQGRRCGHRTKSPRGFCPDHADQVDQDDHQDSHDENVSGSPSSSAAVHHNGAAAAASAGSRRTPRVHTADSLRRPRRRSDLYDWPAATKCAATHVPYKLESHGYIYVIAGIPAQESAENNTVKVGRTSRSPEQRLKELKQENPGRNYHLVYAVETNFNCLLEGTVHRLLKPFQRNLGGRGAGSGKTEHFEVTADEALSCILQCGKLIARERGWDVNDVLIKNAKDYTDDLAVGTIEVVDTVDTAADAPDTVPSGEGDSDSTPSPQFIDVKKGKEDSATIPSPKYVDVQKGITYFRAPRATLYHGKTGCGRLSRTKNPIPISLAEAEAANLRPCSCTVTAHL